MDITPEQLRDALKLSGRSQSELARRLKLDQSAVNRIVKGTRLIKAHELPVIREYLAQTGDGISEPMPVSRQVFVVGTVKAGYWSEVWDETV